MKHSNFYLTFELSVFRMLMFPYQSLQQNLQSIVPLNVNHSEATIQIWLFLLSNLVTINYWWSFGTRCKLHKQHIEQFVLRSFLEMNSCTEYCRALSESYDFLVMNNFYPSDLFIFGFLMEVNEVKAKVSNQVKRKFLLGLLNIYLVKIEMINFLA